MAFRHTYFSLKAFDPRPALDRLRNPFAHDAIVHVRGRALAVHWTKRAETRLRTRTGPLFVELQWYFSCVVQKRVLISDAPPDEIDDWVTAEPNLRIRVRTIESAICDPATFAREHPARRTLDNAAALRMVPHRLDLDVHGSDWTGDMRFNTR